MRFSLLHLPRIRLCVIFIAILTSISTTRAEENKVSYQRDVLPILRENCLGCHQPAAKRGDYLMTDFASLLSGGESGQAAIVPNQADQSHLLTEITPHDGVAEMPKSGKPLTDSQIDIIRRWINEGAINDSTPKTLYNKDNPPHYVRPPVLTAIDHSPDGSLIAVSGFNEVLLLDTATNQIKHRLIGLSPRIESIRFSHDGTRVAVAAGEPGLNGELQIWNSADGSLQLSKAITGDTLFGVNWSPDDKLISFACADNTVRCVTSDSGEQVLYQGAHNDWPRATVFSVSGQHLLSAGRDMTVKLTEVATQRFIDNVTSITPGALRGGINAIARHPARDEIIVGSADGVPKIYRVFRQTARQIGDDANLIRRLPDMTGRVFDVAISHDARFIAAVSTLDQKSFVRLWKYETPENVPDDIKAIQSKMVFYQTAEEKQKLEAFVSAEPVEVSRMEVNSAAYSISISSKGLLSVGASDGKLRSWNTENGQLVSEVDVIAAVDLLDDQQQNSLQDLRQQLLASYDSPEQTAAPKPATNAIDVSQIASLSATPAKIDLATWLDYVQLNVTATLNDGSLVDVTRQIERSGPCDPIVFHASGLIEPKQVGDSLLNVSLGGHSISIPVHVGDTTIHDVDFIRDVNPALSRMGCNQGTCHGSQAGKNGFKLSLRGYDPLFDVRSLTDDLASRRVNFSSPSDSLMIAKPTGLVPHAGGLLMKRGDLYSTIVERWISQGANLNTTSTKATRIDVYPQNPVVADANFSQQIRVVATYADGSTRDVTREAFVESGNTEVAQVDRTGLATALRRGEAPLLARYEGNYAATTLTVMGNRDGYQWQQPETWNKLDQLVAEKWQRLKIQPSDVCSDSDFIRRVYIDLTGLPPSADQVRAFLENPFPTRVKRDALIDQLVGSENYNAFWTNKWADLLQVNSKFLGKEGAAAFRTWIADRIASNSPYDRFVRDVLTASGSNRENPAASYYKILRTPEDTMENTTHLFLAVRFNCNKCHDHPFERWTQDQYYETAAFFAQVGLKRDDASGDRTIGGTAVEGAKPLYEEVYDRTDGEVTHQRTAQTVAPKQPFDCDFTSAENDSRRQELAAWLTSADNPYFARSYVNRLWGYLFGVGLIEPLDDIRAGNPASIPAVLDELEREFIDSGFNVQHVVKLICKSRVYQLDSATNAWNQDDQRNYSHATARRLPAEVLYDAVHFVTGTELALPGVDKGTRAVALPDADAGLSDGFLTNLGRPARESACECERSNDLQLGAVMALLSGPTIGNAISQTNNALHQLVTQTSDNRKLIDKLYMRVLNRPAQSQEVDACQPVFEQIPQDHKSLEQLLQDKEAWWVEEKVKREEARIANLAASKEKLIARVQEVAPERARLEAERVQRENDAKAAAEANRVAWQSNLDPWFASKASKTRWDLLSPVAVETTNGANLIVQPDRSIVASGNKDKGVYHITISPAVRLLNTIRLEALTDAASPGNGPGFPANGNFVVTEIELFAGPAADPAQWKKIKLSSGKTDFDQGGFSAAAAIDDKLNDQGGWAVANAGGVEHWAVFALEQPLTLPEDWVAQIRIHQFHEAAEHRLAHFRLSAANREGELQLGLPENFASLALVPAASRSESQLKVLNDYYVRSDAEHLKMLAAIGEAGKPLPPDAKMVEIQTMIGRLEQPIKDDVNLVQLRSDFEYSKKQMEQLRVTAAEDITWALINSPAFLFNH
jgi:WD40 repeat protein